MKRLTAPLSVISETFALEENTLDLSGRNLDRDQWIYGMGDFLRRRKNVKKLANILNLSHNRLEKLPNIFLQLINLTCLYVNNNRLSSLPESMKYLKRLQELDLRNNQLKVLDVVRKLPDLRKLLVEGNPLTLVEIRSLIKHVDTTTRLISVDIAGSVTWIYGNISFAHLSTMLSRSKDCVSLALWWFFISIESFWSNLFVKIRASSRWSLSFHLRVEIQFEVYVYSRLPLLWTPPRGREGGGGRFRVRKIESP